MEFKGGLSFPRKLSLWTVDNYPVKELNMNTNLGNEINSYAYIFTSTVAYIQSTADIWPFPIFCCLKKFDYRPSLCKLSRGKTQTSSLPWTKGRLRSVNGVNKLYRGNQRSFWVASSHLHKTRMLWMQKMTERSSVSFYSSAAPTCAQLAQPGITPAHAE